MLSPDKINLLQAFLGGLPPHLANRLAKAVEIDRLAEGKSLPHDLILAGLRPVLRESSGERTLTPLRLFCLPFEDLLSSEPRKEKQKGRIARESVSLVWKWLGETLIPDATQAYVKDTRDMTLAVKLGDPKTRAQQFWPEASFVIRSALTADRDGIRAKFGNLVAADAEEMALLLSAGHQILEIHERLPRPTPSLNDPLLWALRDFYDRLVASAPDVAPYVAVIAMNRLARPWEALKLPLLISRRTGDTLIASTDMGLAGELLLDDMAAHAEAIHSIRQPWFDTEDLLSHVSQFAVLSSALVKEVEI